MTNDRRQSEQSPPGGTALGSTALPSCAHGVHRAARTRRAFTLVELLVAVSVVAILTLGIGQIFGSVSKLVGTGSALAEVDQMARTVEAQLRNDFAALARMEEDETFLAIRNTRIGDIDFDGNFEPGSGEIDLYLTVEEEEADIRDDLDPYQQNSQGRVLSRAVTIRADEIMFIGQSGQGYSSYQGGQAGRQIGQHALISWGHALRPPIHDPDDEPPRRLNYADGYLGAAAGDDNRFSPSGNDPVQGRNRFASDFVLSRQALVLLGATAFGYPASNGNVPPAPLGADAEIVMYPRDIEAFSLLFGDSPEDPDDIDIWPLGGLAPDDGRWGRDWRTISKPRLNRHGRTDICAMDRADVQRWLEGGVPSTNPTNADGLPWSTGTLPSDLFGSNFGLPNGPLWFRQQYPPSGPPRLAYLNNLRGIQSAIAGMFSRKLVETDPPDYRFDPADYDTPEPDPRDRRMDIHTVLAEHCTNFEIAWSDGSVWNGGNSGNQILVIDRDGDGRGLAPNEREITPGQRIWFDMDFTYSDLWEELGTDERKNEAMYPRPNPDPEIGLTQNRLFQRLPLANDPAQSFSVNRSHDRALSVMDDSDGLVAGAYSTKFNQTGFEDPNDAAAENEYLAIWGFNPPSGFNRELTASTGPTGSLVGRYERDINWTKPELVRIRVTLQDSQNRLVRGKTYEFIFAVGLN